MLCQGRILHFKAHGQGKLAAFPKITKQPPSLQTFRYSPIFHVLSSLDPTIYVNLKTEINRPKQSLTIFVYADESHMVAVI